MNNITQAVQSLWQGLSSYPPNRSLVSKLPTMPDEILVMISSHLTTYRDLKALCRVSKKMCSIARGQIYSKIDLNAICAKGSARTLTRLLLTLRKNPHLCTQVHELSIGSLNSLNLGLLFMRKDQMRSYLRDIEEPSPTEPHNVWNLDAMMTMFDHERNDCFVDLFLLCTRHFMTLNVDLTQYVRPLHPTRYQDINNLTSLSSRYLKQINFMVERNLRYHPGTFNSLTAYAFQLRSMSFTTRSKTSDPSGFLHFAQPSMVHSFIRCLKIDAKYMTSYSWENMCMIFPALTDFDYTCRTHTVPSPEGRPASLRHISHILARRCPQLKRLQLTFRSHSGLSSPVSTLQSWEEVVEEIFLLFFHYEAFERLEKLSVCIGGVVTIMRDASREISLSHADVEESEQGVAESTGWLTSPYVRVALSVAAGYGLKAVHRRFGKTLTELHIRQLKYLVPETPFVKSLP